MYKVVTAFYDLEDNKHRYEVGDTYPRGGYEPSAKRVEFLDGTGNKLGVPVIQMAADAEDMAADAEEKKPKRTRKKA